MEAKNGEADIVIVAACGERAGEVVEILKEFPELEDPKTGRSLMERTIIICNTSVCNTQPVLQPCSRKPLWQLPA